MNMLGFAHVRGSLLSLAVTGVVMVGASGAPPVDLHGVTRAGGQPAEDAVVWLEAPSAAATPQTRRVVLSQRNLTFSPHVLVVRVGTVVDFPNDDRVFHNVFSFRDGKRFDLGLYPVGSSRKVTFDHAGVSRLFCNIHANMAGYVIVVDSPYFGQADRSGAFMIADVPDGTYRYHAWRPGAVSELTGTWTPTGKPLTIEWR